MTNLGAAREPAVVHRTRFATATACYELAGLAVQLGCSERAAAELMASRFDAFATTGPAEWRLVFETTGPPPAEVSSPNAAHNEAVEVGEAGSRLYLHGDTFSAEVDLERHGARVTGPLACYPVDLTLRYLLPHAVQDGLILHGGMLHSGGRGWAFCGDSGAGKSTLARLLPELACCDELVAVRRRPGGWQVLSLPYWNGRRAAAELDSLLLLEHGPDHRLVPLRPGHAVRELTGLVIWPSGSPGMMAACFHNLAELAREVAVLRLAFAPEAGVWPLIRNRS